jgi:lipoprotein NlpD
VRRLALGIAFLALAGCAARGPAPVVERAAPTPPPVVDLPAPTPEPAIEKPVPTHVVKRGETLASIALQHGLEYRELAAWNNIVNPNRLEVGRVLVLQAPAGSPPVAAPVTTPLATGARRSRRVRSPTHRPRKSSRAPPRCLTPIARSRR